jgi:hypothetical protein
MSSADAGSGRNAPRPPARLTESTARAHKTAADPDDLRARLSEAEETLRAIRNGEVDALVVHDATPDAQVFTLSSADRPYRMFVEHMRDGAATVSQTGTVLYATSGSPSSCPFRFVS